MARSQHSQSWDDILAHIQRQMSRKTLGWLTADYLLLDGQDTLLHVLARRWEYRKILRELLRQMQLCGLSVDIKDARGFTALHLAIMYHCHDKVTQLLEFGASVCNLNAQGLTPIHIATQSDNKIALEALFRAGAALDGLDMSGRQHLEPIVEQMLNNSIDAVEGPSLAGVRLGCVLGSCATARQYYYNHTGRTELAKTLVDVTMDEELEALSYDILHPCCGRSQSANYSSARHDILEHVLQRRPFMTEIDYRNMVYYILESPPANDKTGLLDLVCRYRIKHGSNQPHSRALLGCDPRILRSLAALEPPQCYDAANILFADRHGLSHWSLELIMTEPTIEMLESRRCPATSAMPDGFHEETNRQSLGLQDSSSSSNDSPVPLDDCNDRVSDLEEYWGSHHWQEYSRPAALERLNSHLRCGLEKPGIVAAVCARAMTAKEQKTAYRAMQCIVHVVSKHAIEFAGTHLVQDAAMCRKLTIEALQARQRLGLPDYCLSSQHLFRLWQAKEVARIPFENLFRL